MASTSTCSSTNRSSICEQLQVLRDKVDLLFQCEEPLRKKQRKAKSSVAQRINLIEKLLKEEPLPLPDAPIKACVTNRPTGFAQPKQPDALSKVKVKDLSSRRSQDGSKKPKKLLISNGCVICLLDLEQCKNELLRNAGYVLPLPKIATLRLIENKLPVSVGLFRLGSSAYMIGGHEFPADWKPCCRPLNDCCRGYSLYTTYNLEKYLKGTSRTAYRLSQTDDGTLIPSKGKIKKLKNPKFWPIVEEIDGQIHVFDSGPWMFQKAGRDWVFSHEVLSCDGHRYRWSKIPTTGAPLGAFITSHIVLGNCIYAVSGQDCLVFDAEKKEWEARDCESRDLSNTNIFYPTQVWEILSVGTARCARKFPVISSEPLYVVIGVVRSPCRNLMDREFSDEDIPPDEVYTHAVAYLVTSMGRVLCSQSLYDFFEGPMQPCRMSTATMIKADAEGKTSCSIVSANSFVDGKEQALVLFITRRSLCVLLSRTSISLRQILTSRRRRNVT